jgi:ferrous iron transport protein B
MSPPVATRLHVALAGQPNVGKSTVFNLLTGLRQHVGNWPGKTVEQKIGVHQHGKVTLDLVDLPGTYSLTANSPEELIAREYLLTQRPDVIVAVVDAAVLERSLYLVAELVQVGLPLVVGLNMIDVATQNGTHIDTRALSEMLGAPVIDLIAAKNAGVDRLIDEAIRIAGEPARSIAPLALRSELAAAVSQIEQLIAPVLPESYPPNWAALKLLESDAAILQQVRDRILPGDWTVLDKVLRDHADAAMLIAGARYAWIAQAVRVSVTRKITGSMTLTARLDRLTTHPLWGPGILAAILAALFGLTYVIGSPIQEWLESTVMGSLSNTASLLLVNAPAWLRGLIVDGAIGGAGTVLTFVPILMIFFAGMALLEDVGYMARAAYLMDGCMRLMGLHGKSFLPLFLGFGCNVPSIMGTRVIESDKARLLSIVLAPLVPCTARMAVVAFLTPAFFGSAAPFVAFGLVLLNLLVLAVVGAIVSRTVLKDGQSAFIMELPLYHQPKPRSIALIVWQRTLGFVRHAGTAILIMSLVVWALAYFPNGNVDTSWLGQIGRGLAPLGALMGLSWKLLIALLASFVAKENSIAVLGVLFGAADNHAQLASILSSAITPIAALSFLAVQLLFIPCASTVAVIRKETQSWRWTLFSIGLLALISFGAGIAIFQAARLFA